MIAAASKVTNGAAFRLTDTLDDAIGLIQGINSTSPRPMSIGGGHPATFFRAPVASGSRDMLSISGYSTFADARFGALRGLAQVDQALTGIDELGPLRTRVNATYDAIRGDASMTDPKLWMRLEQELAPLGRTAREIRNDIVVAGKHLDDTGEFPMQQLRRLNY